MPIFQSLDLELMLIYQKFVLWKSAIFHSIKLPFHVQAAEKILHVIYYATMNSIALTLVLCKNVLEPSWTSCWAYLLRQNYKISGDYLCWIVKGVSFHTEVHISDKYKSRLPWRRNHFCWFSKLTNIHSIS